MKQVLYEVIFGYETRAGKLFDLALIILIFASVLAVMLDSVPSVNARYHDHLLVMEWAFTLLFTIEYGLRLYSSPSMKGYAFSFYGLVDLLSILPTYIALLLPGTAFLVVIRILRVLRIFRVLKLSRYVGEANILLRAILMARRKLLVFFYGVLILVVVFGTLMFIVEGPENGFTSIPISMYWAIVTITTVGYGDISPHTWLGQLIASMAMLTGYAIIAVPFGIFSSELMSEFQRQQKPDRDFARLCDNCNLHGHDRDAEYCRKCGVELPGHEE